MFCCRPSPAQVSKFGAVDAVWNSDHWVSAVDIYLLAEEKYRKELLTVSEMGSNATIRRLWNEWGQCNEQKSGL